MQALRSRKMLTLGLLFLAPILSTPDVQGLDSQDAEAPIEDGFSVLLGRPTDTSVTLSLLSDHELDVNVECGAQLGSLTERTIKCLLAANAPCEVKFAALKPNTRYYYRVVGSEPGTLEPQTRSRGMFHTQRPPGSAFVFALQGDSHPERNGKMFDPGLYTQTMRNVAQEQPDFYLTMGDDFSIERLISSGRLNQLSVDQVYRDQRGFLGVVGQSSALFLVNGNHEQAAQYLLDGTENSAAVFAGRARLRFYPLPAPDGFYSGNSEEMKYVGLPRDYYAWTWGDALFVIIDPYWHSASPVDNTAGVEGHSNAQKDRGAQKRNLWQNTLGETQYRWLANTLAESTSKWKFVFCHHVLGTGRGGIEMADLFEWGGNDRKGTSMFAAERPGWALPIHDLMVKNKVTVFFQGHDHLYARQELDGVIYQSVPSPADPTYEAFNRDAYHSGVILPNSGHLRVTVAPGTVTVAYVSSVLSSDEREGQTNAALAHVYSIPRIQ